MDTAIEIIEKHGLGANGNNIPCVHGLLPVDWTRRTLSLAAAFAVPAVVTAALFGLADPAQASPAHAAQAGAVSVAIDSMNPQFARPGATVSVAGTVSNGTAQTKTGLEVQLSTSPTPFSARDQMDGYLSQSGDTSVEAVGKPFVIAASLRPGATVEWRASFNVSSVGITEFGVYPLVAQAEDQAGDVLASDQTVLPFWPGQQAAGLLRPLEIAWIWPLIDQPHNQVCTALTNNGLAASLGQGGRLSALLAAGRAHPDAELTWVIDPALLSDVETMTRSYWVDSTPTCTDATEESSSKAAVAWLSMLRKVTSNEPTVITPYANADVSALVHNHLNAELAAAYTMGKTVARNVLHGSFGPTIAIPPGGTADLGVLTTLATTEGIGTVVLDSSEMPPANSAVFEDDAITSVRTKAGTTMNVLLADHTLTGVLAAGDSSSGVLPPSTLFAVRQRFLAETAMIAAEAPNSARSIVVAPPEGWSPSATLASELLSETIAAPWLRPTALGSLTRSADSGRAIVRRPPPDNRESPGELSSGYLSTVKTLSTGPGGLDVYKAMLYRPLPSYVQSLNEALAATESAAWRGSGMSQGVALTDSLSSYLTSAEKKVKILTSGQVSMGGASGAVPVSIQNGLHQAIQVRINASVVNSPGRTSQLTVGRFENLRVIPPQQSVPVRLPVSSAPQGSTVIKLSLTSANGKPLPFATASLTVQSTRYGRAILFLIGAAIGVLVLTSVYRGVRQWLRADARAAEDAEDAGLPGSVVTGTSGTRHPTEAPDDLADARRWVDDA
jgi:Family of unknown function (DUF6049)